jgi:hypothetical protein
MDNAKNDHAQRTEKLLLSVFEYCQANGLKMWRTDSTFFSKYVVGEEDDFKTAKKSPFNYSSNSIEEVKKEDILNSTHYFIFRHGGDEKNITVNPYPDWATDSDDPRYTQLYIRVFLENEKDIAKHFSEDWFKGKINLTHAIDYKDEKYPEGFLDKKLTPYNLGKNWHHFIDTIEGQVLDRSWENDELFDQFYQRLKELDPDGSKRVANSFLNKLTEKLCETGLSDNSKLKTSYMLMDLLPERLHEGYVGKFPLMRNLIDAQNKEKLFQQTDDEITERCVFSKGHIYEYFKFAKLQASQYENIGLQALRFIGENKQLEEKGIICANAFTTNDDLLFFVAVNDNTLINKESMKNLFISSLETFFNHPDVVLTDNNKGVDNREILRKVINTNIEHWILKDELSNSPNNDPPVKKVKKI